MKYNIYEILFVCGFMLFCFDNTIILIIGVICMLIGGAQIQFHIDDYIDDQKEYFDEIDEVEYNKHVA